MSIELISLLVVVLAMSAALLAALWSMRAVLELGPRLESRLAAVRSAQVRLTAASAVDESVSTAHGSRLGGTAR